MTLWFDNRSWTSSTSAMSPHRARSSARTGSRSWAIWRFGQTIHTDSEQPFRPWTWTTNRIWPVYYDSSSQMLCQMVQTPQHETATPGTANTSWQVLPSRDRVHTTIHSNRRDAASFQDSRPPPDAVPVTVLLETPTLLRCSIPSLPRTGHDAIRIRKLQRSPTTWQLYRCGNRTSLLMQRRSNAILPCTNYCNKGTLTYLLQAMAVKG
jgi:hypothetical protein